MSNKGISILTNVVTSFDQAQLLWPSLATPPHPFPVAPAGALLLATGPLSTKAQQNSIYSKLQSDSELSTLKAAVDAAGLADALSDSTLPYTVFAPTNAVSTYRRPLGTGICGYPEATRTGLDISC